ncbi:MAG: hypothetical protein Q4A15_05565 [Prevotellaceae bacterium]|nr:hypothetical protein [Prevotellaceae bacterium]
MKAIMISFDQAHYDGVIEALNNSLARGFTMFPSTQGRGSKTGDPHMGTHAWPSMCSSVITIVEDEKVEPLLNRLKALDESYEMLGLRAFVWDIEKTI